MIKSPLSKVALFDSKIKTLLEKEKIEAAMIFYIPKKGDVFMTSFGMCGHQLLTLSEAIKDVAEEMLKNEEEHS